MPERLTERARQVMALANQEAHHLHHEYLGTEHVLLGIIKEAGGIAADALKSLGLDLARVRTEVEKLVPRGADAANIGKLPQTPKARKMLEHAIEEARSQHHGYVGTEHLLVGMLLEPDCVAARALTQMGIDLTKVRSEIDHLLGPEAAAPTDTSGQLIRRAVECLLRARDVAITEGNPARASELQTQAWAIGEILTRRSDADQPSAAAAPAGQ